MAAVKAPSTLKVLVFPMQRVHLALRIESVERVIPRPTIHSSGLSAIGVVEVARQAVTVLDLEQRLYHRSSVLPNDDGYLILIRRPSGECFGIPVAQPPTLLEVPMANIRALPLSYRKSDTLGIASHVAQVNMEEESLTIFLLDGELLWGS